MSNGASKKKASAKAETGESNSGKSLVRKITNKALFSDSGGKPKLADGEDRKELGTVIGIARSVKTGESDYGPWTKLVGGFEATTHDGRVLQSPQCILPEPMQGMIAENLADENTESIQFAVRVFMKRAESATGYEYGTETIVDTDTADPLADLRSRALEHQA